MSATVSIYTDDGNGGCKGTVECGDHEIVSNGACICDNNSNYYGEAENCQICEGTGKIIKDNTCVCDGVDYTDDGNGGCKSIAECSDHEIEKNGACVCDENNMYYGDAGNCQKCEGVTKTVRNNQCVCDDTSILSDDACICANELGFYGEAGHCMYCNNIGTTVVDNECVCDEELNYHGTPDNCHFCAPGAVWKDNTCVCDEDNLYYGTDPNFCTHCGDDKNSHTVIKNNQCVCDENKSYYGTPGNCQLCHDRGTAIKNNECVCDEDNGYYGIAPNCQYCDSTSSTIIDHQCVCDETKNYYNAGNKCQYCDPETSSIKDHDCICDESRDYYLLGGYCQYCGYEGVVYQDGRCICDASNGYYGYVNYYANDCKKCDAEGTTIDNNKCVCDQSNGYYGEAGSCEKCDGVGKTVLNNKCICDERNRYYGEAGSCMKCEGPGLYVVDNQCSCATGWAWQEDPNHPGTCICQDGYVNMKDGVLDPNLGGTCEPITRCYDRMVLQETTNTCVCDIDHNWQGTFPDCYCDWQSGDYVQVNYNTCERKATCDPVKETYDSRTNSCVCNEEGNWLGTPGECSCGGGDSSYVLVARDGNTLCEPIAVCSADEHTVLNAEDNTCVCDADNNWLYLDGRCRCDDKRTNDNGKCVCDTEDLGYSTDASGNCFCDAQKHLIDRGSYCACDADNHWIPEKWLSSYGDLYKCVCDSTVDYYQKGNRCVKCNGITVDPYTCIYQPGDIVTFGHYLQSNEETKEPLQWRILEIDQENRKLFLVSEYVIDVQAYDELELDEYTNPIFRDVTWENCTLRTWMNDVFMNEAFDATEQASILLTHLSNKPNPYYPDVPAGNDTDDRIFLLSYADVSDKIEPYYNPTLGITIVCNECGKYFNSDSQRVAIATKHALKLGVYASASSVVCSNDSNETCAARWWLRSPGRDSKHVSDVNVDGMPHSGGDHAATGSKKTVTGEHLLRNYIGIRPALWRSY